MVFIGGFILDSLTLQRIDLPYVNIILLAYLLVAIAGVLLLDLVREGKFKWRKLTELSPWFLFVTQFAFGGLFSGFAVFYGQSGVLSSSWPFLLLLVGLLVGNEFFKKHYEKLVFQMSILYFVLFSYFVFLVPVLVGHMGALMFLLSGVLSLMAITGIILSLERLLPKRIEENRSALRVSIVAIFAGMNLLYFTNILPPIPLSLKDIGVYHSVSRTTDGYMVEREDVPWYRVFLNGWKRVYHRAPGESVYVYSAVFAPTRIETDIVHEWQQYDEQQGKYVTTNTVAFPIVGGADGGYRGYSLKGSVRPGKWRVNVRTSRGQLIGRATFRIENVDAMPELVREVK